MTIDSDLHQIVGEHKALIMEVREDLREIKENQKLFSEYVLEAKAEKDVRKQNYRYILFVLAGFAGLVTFAKDLLATVANYLTFRGYR